MTVSGTRKTIPWHAFSESEGIVCTMGGPWRFRSTVKLAGGYVLDAIHLILGQPFGMRYPNYYAKFCCPDARFIRCFAVNCYDRTSSVAGNNIELPDPVDSL